MRKIERKVLEQLLDGLAEPLLLARTDQSKWPIVFCNPAFTALAPEVVPLKKPLADVIELIGNRELAREISESVRSGKESTSSIEIAGNHYFLVLRPISTAPRGAGFCAIYLRNAASSTSAVVGDAQQALIKARSQIRDLSRDDPVTGLLNENSFREILAHDWAVAARENASLALVAFLLDDFGAYVDVFGRHAADSCQRRIAQTIRRCLRRASDVAAKVELPGKEYLLVLSHASNEDGVNDFATSIANEIRNLGIHHPRSKADRFVTVSFRAAVMQAGSGRKTAEDFLQAVLND